MEKCHKRRIRQNAISFSPFLLFSAGGTLKSRVRVRLGNHALAVLLVLIEHAAEVVDAKVWIAKVWLSQAIKRASLGFQIEALRRVLGNGKFRCVTDVPRGCDYCFVAPMTLATLTPSTAENGPSTFSARSAHALHIKVADLASVAALSRFHFSRAVRGTMGKTPHRFVSGPRLEKAEALLAKGAMTLEQVAAGCNFSFPASFTRAFRSAAGLPLGEYRRHTSADKG
jgi:AraC-like DNA-binding protein